MKKLTKPALQIIEAIEQSPMKRLSVSLIADKIKRKPQEITNIIFLLHQKGILGKYKISGKAIYYVEKEKHQKAKFN